MVAKILTFSCILPLSNHSCQSHREEGSRWALGGDGRHRLLADLVLTTRLGLQLVYMSGLHLVYMLQPCQMTTHCVRTPNHQKQHFSRPVAGACSCKMSTKPKHMLTTHWSYLLWMHKSKQTVPWCWHVCAHCMSNPQNHRSPCLWKLVGFHVVAAHISDMT